MTRAMTGLALANAGATGGLKRQNPRPVVR
jgi:hypothetical protein